MKSVVDELNAIQEQCGYLPAEELVALSERTNIPLYRLHGVASFYPHFFLQPPAALEVKVCGDICCHLRGAAELTATLQARYSRDPDLRLTTTSCLGQCERGPALMVNETVLAANGTGDLLDRVEH